MNKVIAMLLAVTVLSGLVCVAAQKVELTRKYEFGPFVAVAEVTGTVVFTLPQELKACVVTLCANNSTSTVAGARSPLETQYKAGYRSTTNTVDLWYPTGVLANSTGTNSFFVPNIKDGILVKGSLSGTPSAFRVIVTAITLQ